MRDFPGQDQTNITVVVYYPSGSPLTEDHVGAIYDLSRSFAAMPNVLRVSSIVDINSSLSRADYQRLYSGSTSQLPDPMQQALASGTGPHLALLNVVTNKQYTSDEARAIVNAVRAEQVPDGQVLATGGTAYDLDIVNFILERTPIAVASVIVPDSGRSLGVVALCTGGFGLTALVYGGLLRRAHEPPEPILAPTG